MTCYEVLLPMLLCEDNDAIYGSITNDKGHFAIIDIIYYNGSAEDCREGLINHDGYNPYIVCVESD